jgi:hypothetical protein
VRFRSKGPLAYHPWIQVQEVIDRLEPKAGHPHGVGVRVDQTDAQPPAVVLADRADLRRSAAADCGEEAGHALVACSTA